MNVEELMTKRVVTCRVDDTLAIAAQKMWETDCGVLPIVAADGRLVGVLTDRDICMSAWSRGRLLTEIPAEHAMSKKVVSVRPDQDVGIAERLMTQTQIRRLPVVDADTRPVGILSLNDLAREASRPGTKLVNGVARAIRTLGAICQPRNPATRAA